MAETTKTAETAKMARTAKMAEMAKTGLGTANTDDSLALLENKGQGRAGSDFYNFFS